MVVSFLFFGFDPQQLILGHDQPVGTVIMQYMLKDVTSEISYTQYPL